MRNVKIDSTTDSEFARRAAGTQPYNTIQVTIATARPSIQRADGSIEHAPDDIQNLEGLVPGRELRQNMLEYSKRVEDFKKQYPDFDRYVNQDVPLPLSARDEILRQENGPDIALFLGFCPDVAEELCKMHPLDAARCVEGISEDLKRLAVPKEEMDQANWKAAKNLVKKAPARKPKP